MDCQNSMIKGDLVTLLSEEEIVWDDAAFEWDHTLIFETREDARDMRISKSSFIPSGTFGTVIFCDANFVNILTSNGVGWSRKHYWRLA